MASRPAATATATISSSVPALATALLHPNPNPFSPPSPPSPLRLSIYHPSLLPLSSPSLSFRSLLQAHAHLLASGLLADPLAAGRLLLSFSSFIASPAGSGAAPLVHLLLLFRSLPAPDAFCANAVVKSLSLSPDPLLALRFYFANLGSEFFPNCFTFPPLLAACARAASPAEGGKCHGQAVKRGADATLHSRNALVNMYASCGLLTSARGLFDGMLQKDLVSWNTMVGGYVESRDLDTARELFDRMPDKNVVSWNVMVGGYLKGKRPECGLELFKEMVEKGLRGTAVTMVSVVTACGRLGRLREGRSVHGYFVRNFVEENLIFGTALVDMYGKCRRVEVARRVFDGMSERNLVCWNAMVVGHCVYGSPQDGLALFEEMVVKGRSLGDAVTDNGSQVDTTRISPDEVTFVGVLCACARAGLLTEGKKYFDQMTSVYNIRPTFAHYWCIANLHGGLGLVQEAEEILRSMPEEMESLLLAGLLGLCRFRGDLELGERIAMRLIELEPHNGSCYSLLCSVYVAANRWEDAGKVKQIMKERGVEPMPGHRLVDLNRIVHSFKLGDRPQPEMEEIYMMMDDLAARLKLTSCGVGSTRSGQE